MGLFDQTQSWIHNSRVTGTELFVFLWMFTVTQSFSGYGEVFSYEIFGCREFPRESSSKLSLWRFSGRKRGFLIEYSPERL